MCIVGLENKQILKFSLYYISHSISTQKIEMDRNIQSLADRGFSCKFNSRTEF